MNAQVKAIRAEIERLLGLNKSFLHKSSPFSYSKGRYSGRIEVLEGLIRFIDSLQREQPSEDLDLEKEIENFLASEDSTSYDNAGTYKVSYKDPKKIARHFYELGKQAKKEE